MTKKKRKDKPQPPPTGDRAPVEGETPAEIQGALELDPDRLAQQRDELAARLQRVSADYLNYQKRVQRDIDEMRRFGITDLVRAMLDVLDDLERAIAHAAANHADDDPLLAGTRLTYEKALDVLKRFGVEPIAAEGLPFDPARHEAIARVPSDEVEPMTVLTETQKGYILSGRTIRPSKVAVAVEIPAESEGPEDLGQEADTDADV